jgi:hypothetical protein
MLEDREERVRRERRRTTGTSKSSEEIDQIANEIEQSLERNLQASDTLAGVQSWWPSRGQSDRTKEAIQTALDRLVAAGKAVKTPLPDGRTRYSAPRSPRSRRR